ncbi:multidrug resistance protein, MFS superfamily [Legionella tucsonensis]|uniref:Multidrug resistance protein, MFS superfamily n=1 Tax=Legionella tucsonensis TaxID=40335 RepID=A0A0W1A040_9GAMM|nr:multidrug resistance protein, MFS superfamily [Legionella tucsonensis]
MMELKILNPDATNNKANTAKLVCFIKSKIFIGYTLCACFACAGLVAYLNYTIAPFLFHNVLGQSPFRIWETVNFYCWRY